MDSMVKLVKKFFATYDKGYLVVLDCVSIVLVLWLMLSVVVYGKTPTLDILVVSVIYASIFLAVGAWLRIYGASIRHLGIDLLFRLSAAAVAAKGWAGIPSLCGQPQTDTLPAQRHRSVIQSGSAGLG